MGPRLPFPGEQLTSGQLALLTPPSPARPLRVYRLHERLVAIRTEYNLRLKSGVVAPVTAPVTQVPLQRRPELEDSALRYLQDLLAWVEENQQRVDGAEWGGDLPSVEAQLGSHRGLHQSIEDFRAKVERAQADEVCRAPAGWQGRDQAGAAGSYTPNSPLQGQISQAMRGAYRESLGRLELQFAKLLVSGCGRGCGTQEEGGHPR